MSIDVVILAAGKGTRMYSDTPKVLHRIAGKPMLSHVMTTARALDPANIIVVTGYEADRIHQFYAGNDQDITWVNQKEQLGTGHAVMQALPSLKNDHTVVVLYGDVPLVQHETVAKLAALAQEHGLAVLTLKTDQPHGLGRIIRNAEKQVVAIVEEKDASAEERKIHEINTGIMAFNANLLKHWLQDLTTDNAQGEYYLTDTVAMANAQGIHIAALTTHDKHEVQGVNNRLQLAELERAFQRHQADELALRGVTLADPARLDVRGELKVGRDVELDVNVVLEGKVSLGNRVRIEANVVIRNSQIGDDTVIHANSIVENSQVGSACHVGPFARLRPDTCLLDGSKIGNFVETKKAMIGAGSKVNHLSYIGDAEIGDDVNVGAGTITCNYDGVNKHKTVIKRGAFIGTNTSLVAPVTVGEMATTGAGSVITTEVPDDNLAVARSRQKNISGWKRPVKK